MAKKDSGIDWIGEIPEDWSIVKIGSLYYERNEHVSALDFEPLSVTKKGILPQLETAAKSDNPNDRKLVRINDFAINSRSDRRGSCGISQYDGSVSLINIVLVPHQIYLISGKFYEYVFHTDRFADEFYRWGHGIVDDLWTTRWQEMKKINLPFPSIEEQIKISSFLDSRTLQIKSLSENLANQIDKLKEYKKALITKCVTKGLDPNVPLKDSGIDWIGKIPENWNVAMVSQVFVEHKEKNVGLYEKNLLSLSYGKIIQKDINANDGLLPENFETYNVVSKNDIVLRLTDLQNDHRSLRVGLVEETGIITSAYIILRSRKEIDTTYFYYQLHVFDIKKGFYGMGSGVRQNLNFDELKKMRIAIPSQEEQEEIADYLDKKCSEIDSLISSKQQQIDKLNEYQKSLIYEYVTGKKEVV